MEANLLLSSKPAYKITSGKLWRIADNKITKKLGLQPSGAVHPVLLEHEWMIGDVFASLIVTGHITAWVRDENPALDDDGNFCWDENKFYLETETGNHGYQRLLEKVIRYKKYYRETHEDFRVLFVMKQSLDNILAVFEAEQTIPHYRACLLDELVADPFAAEQHHREGVKTF